MTIRVRLDQILEALDGTSALDGLNDAIFALRDLFAVNHMVYHWVDSAGDQYGCGTYSDEWRLRYVEQNYLRVDPVVVRVGWGFRCYWGPCGAWLMRVRGARAEGGGGAGVGASREAD